jgi:uncharacterized DUF497 family protein
MNNIALRGISFERAVEWDFLGAATILDDRRDYGEVRYRSYGLLDDRMHVMGFTLTARGVRIISLRRANRREVKRYGS